MTTMRSLEEYDISPVTGFLPPEPPLRRLDNPYFLPWETMMDDFNGLLLAGKLREKILKMPLLDYKYLNTIQEYRRAFLILCMLSHSYIWGKHEEASETLPANLAVPWTGIAEELGLCPVVCHAAVVLWNYRLLDSEGPIELANLTTLATYSGSLDESWFYLITTAIESAGSKCPAAILSCVNHVCDGNYEGLRSDLTTIHAALMDINVVLHRMFEKCDPYVFYWKIRPYLAGWENMAEAGLPLGVIYEGVDSLWSAETDEYGDISHLTEEERLLRQYRRYAGGSAAQSSLIAAFDVAFGVQHHPVGEKSSSTSLPPIINNNNNNNSTPYSPVDKNDRYRHLPLTRPADELDHSGTSSGATTPLPPYKRTNRNAFLRAMRKYMPAPHRQYLEDLETASNIRPFMMHLEALFHSGEITDEECELVELYNECLHQLKLFRDKHVQIVSLYIVNQARKGPNISHGGFAMEKKADIPQPSSSTGSDNGKPAPKKTLHNMLYPQTALETHPGIRDGSPSAKISSLFPQLGLAKHVDPKSGVVRGTGGTNVMPFLKQSRDETAEMKIALEKVQQLAQETLEETKSWTDMLLRR
ncbi:Indoleamine 2,3-dioxygenase [Halteromyces radiatus]|uniref:Indoleamine 2,3-dioxygenase n=1 Tax=Halteromyces radiatus TaxID=101107 RepID=UPI00221F93CE|nr:Indoleamine 2,3-dioxygenase [Halteromyces radiatus]KAI8081672.1 Indoleamine 2,3-dioxygenase [Halteromyces radiatus]